MTRAPSNRLPEFSFRRLFPVVFVAVFLMHAPLLRLPFFWDEAGFYVPAAYDMVHSHSVIATTTLDTGHPPLSASYLALWFTLSGWKPAVARVAMLLLAAFALTNVFLLARRLAGTGVAVATTAATAVYPIFFVQSSLTHADLTAAAFTLWGIRLYIERRVWPSQFAFCLAVLSKETAIITPMAFALWEILHASGQGERSRLHRAALALVPVVPLLGWLAYHHHATGRFFGNADFYQYNVTQALSPLRFVLALTQRVWHLFGTMNMLALTAATAVAMFFPPVIDDSGERPRIAIPVQLQFGLVMLAHLLAFSLLGGALLTRYLLPAYPLVIMIGMSTLRRRIGRWEWPAALMVMVFVLGLFFDPPYRFAPEDNLTYKDFVDLHYEAAKFLERHEQKSTILTAWPASDEITKPYLGYVAQSFPLAQVQDFTVEQMIKARQMRSQYQVAYLFSTKNDVPPWIRSELWEKLNRRFFGSHVDVSPELAAEFLHGKIVFLARRKAEWVAVLEMDQASSVAAVDQKHEEPLSRIEKNLRIESLAASSSPQKQKHSYRPTVLSFYANSFPEEKLCALQLKQDPCQHRMNVCVIPEIRKHQSRRLYHPEPPLPFHGPTSPALLASCLNFQTRVGKRPLLIGGENLHLFPVVSKLGTTVETHHVRSRMCGSLTAALSWLAGLGKADPLVPASEQSVKDIHNLPPGCLHLLSSLRYLGRPKTFIPLD